MKRKINIAILGTGNIGADLFFKALKSRHLNCVLFTGRGINSSSFKAVKKFVKRKNLKDIKLTDGNIKSIVKFSKSFDIIFDCTSARFHEKNLDIFKKLKKKIINLTPSKTGKICVPAINLEDSKQTDEINMTTCGAQSSVPIAYSFGKVFKKRVSYIEVVSTISSKSAGPATRLNLDEYIYSTQKATSLFTKVKKTKAILNLNPAEPEVYMQTTIFVKISGSSVKNNEFREIKRYIGSMAKKVKTYNPGYEIIVAPHLYNNVIATTVRTIGVGDYLPKYAGNLDIITSAAIRVAENYEK